MVMVFFSLVLEDIFIGYFALKVDDKVKTKKSWTRNPRVCSAGPLQLVA